MTKEAYKDHRAGSPKGEVHRVFDTKGKDAAIKKAVSFDLQEATARTWISSWKSGKVKKAKATKKAVKAAAPSKKVVKKAAAPKRAKKPVKRERATPSTATEARA